MALAPSSRVNTTLHLTMIHYHLLPLSATHSLVLILARSAQLCGNAALAAVYSTHGIVYPLSLSLN